MWIMTQLVRDLAEANRINMTAMFDQACQEVLHKMTLYLPPGAGSRSCGSSCRPSRRCPHTEGWRTHRGPWRPPPAAYPAWRWRLSHTPENQIKWIGRPSWEIKTLRSCGSLLSSVCLISLDKYREEGWRLERGPTLRNSWDKYISNGFCS